MDELIRQLREIKDLSINQLSKESFLVGNEGITYWFGYKATKEQPLRISQMNMLEAWKGHFRIVADANEVLEAIGL